MFILMTDNDFVHIWSIKLKKGKYFLIIFRNMKIRRHLQKKRGPQIVYEISIPC